VSRTKYREIIVEELTSPPERYVPMLLVFGPTSILGKENRNTLRGSYAA
jgi:hypothetical protein